MEMNVGQAGHRGAIHYVCLVVCVCSLCVLCVSVRADCGDLYHMGGGSPWWVATYSQWVPCVLACCVPAPVASSWVGTEPEQK
jgi:hypothetical protein